MVLRRYCLLDRRSDADECFDAANGSGIARMGGAAAPDGRRQGSRRSFSARARRAAFLPPTRPENASTECDAKTGVVNAAARPRNYDAIS